MSRLKTCENCGDEEEVLHYTEWNEYECGDLCEVCSEMFLDMEDEDD